MKIAIAKAGDAQNKAFETIKNHLDKKGIEYLEMKSPKISGLVDMAKAVKNEEADLGIGVCLTGGTVTGTASALGVSNKVLGLGIAVHDEDKIKAKIDKFLEEN